jgi:hypothetical protein
MAHPDRAYRQDESEQRIREEVKAGERRETRCPGTMGDFPAAAGLSTSPFFKEGTRTDSVATIDMLSTAIVGLYPGSCGSLLSESMLATRDHD